MGISSGTMPLPQFFNRENPVKHHFLTSLCLCAALSALTLTPVAAETAGECVKAGSQVPVAGSSAAEQKADCARQGGNWSGAASGESSSAGQSAGSGGGW